MLAPSGRSVRTAPAEPDIYDVIEADNTAMERVAKSKARDIANSTPTHSSNHSIIGRGSRGILKRGKSSRRGPGSDSVGDVGFSDVKSVSRCVFVRVCPFPAVRVQRCLVMRASRAHTTIPCSPIGPITSSLVGA